MGECLDDFLFSSATMTLGGVLEAIDLPVLHPVELPRGLDVVVSGLVIYEPHEPLLPCDGAALLLIGVAPNDAGARTLLVEVGRMGYSAVVMKPHGAPVTVLSEAAREAGVALLSASPEVGWRELDCLIIAALGSGGVAAQAGSSTSVAELFDLVNTLSEGIGGSVVVEDLEQHILAHSSITGQRIDASRRASILNRRVPDLPWHREQYMKVLMSSGPVRFPALRDELPRIAVAIRSGNSPLGTIWAIEGEVGQPGEETERALTEAAQVAAVHLLRHATRHESDQHQRSDALAAVINGVLPVEEAARRWSLPSGSEITLFAFAPCAPGFTTASGLAHLTAMLKRHLTALRPDAICATARQVLFLLVPDSGAPVAALARRLAQAIAAATGDQVRSALGATTTDLNTLPMSAEDLEDILTSIPPPTLADEVWDLQSARHHILLRKTAQLLEVRPGLRDSALRSVLDHDARQGTRYAQTLAVWLDHFGDWSNTASALNMHPNSVRYRISRIEEKHGLDLNDARTRLAVWLELSALGLAAC